MRAFGVAAIIVCVAVTWGASTEGAVVSSMALLDRVPVHVPGSNPDLEYDWSQTLGTFTSDDGRVGYNDFIAHDGINSGLRQVYTIGFNDQANDTRWAEYLNDANQGENTITLNGPDGFIGELHTKAYSPSGYNVIGRFRSSVNAYDGGRDANTWKSGMGDLLAKDQRFWFYFTSSTHDILGIALITSDGYFSNGNPYGATVTYRLGGFGGDILLSTNGGTRLSGCNSNNNFMGYINANRVDTLEIDLSTIIGGKEGDAFRFDEMAIIVQRIEHCDDIGAVVPESGGMALWLMALGLSLSHRRRSD
jgi:MYXO-CTERM domain-containing protein